MKMILDAILLCCFAALVWRVESFPTGKRVAIATQLQASCNLAKPMGIATYVSVSLWFKGALLQVQGTKATTCRYSKNADEAD